MGERKVLNKYFPPDFDPAELPKGQRQKDNAMKVRMMLPMTVRCGTCGEFMYRGTKFNCKKEDVTNETYLGIQIFRFYMHCRKCSAEITYITDPQNMDYKVEHGATRNFEQWKAEQTIEEALKAKREAEDEDRLKRLENKTADAKREMDLMDTLDDLLHVKHQHAAIRTEDAISALQARAAEVDAAEGRGAAEVAGLPSEDVAAIRKLVEGGLFTRRLEDGAEDAAAAAPAGFPKRIAPAAAQRAGAKLPRTVRRQDAVATRTGDAGQRAAGSGKTDNASIRKDVAVAGQARAQGGRAGTALPAVTSGSSASKDAGQAKPGGLGLTCTSGQAAAGAGGLGLGAYGDSSSGADDE